MLVGETGEILSRTVSHISWLKSGKFTLKFTLKILPRNSPNAIGLLCFHCPLYSLTHCLLDCLLDGVCWIVSISVWIVLDTVY